MLGFESRHTVYADAGRACAPPRAHRAMSAAWQPPLTLSALLLLYRAAVALAQGQVTPPVNNCGDLPGSCNSRVCCCSSSGLLTQTPTDDGQCKWQVSSGIEGAVFLMVAAVVPAILLVCTAALPSRSMRLKRPPGLATSPKDDR